MQHRHKPNPKTGAEQNTTTKKQTNTKRTQHHPGPEETLRGGARQHASTTPSAAFPPSPDHAKTRAKRSAMLAERRVTGLLSWRRLKGHMAGSHQVRDMSKEQEPTGRASSQTTAMQWCMSVHGPGGSAVSAQPSLWKVAHMRYVSQGMLGFLAGMGGRARARDTRERTRNSGSGARQRDILVCAVGMRRRGGGRRW